MPLTGLTYKTDTRKVHQLIHGFVQGENADTWINPKDGKQDGLLDYLALLDNYGGEDNKAVRVTEAEALWTSLIYKNERAMSFYDFLKNMQTMFTGLSDNGEILNNSQKICLIYQKFQNSILIQIKASIKVSYDLDQSNTVTYDFISNILVAEAASIIDHNPRRVTDVNTCGKKAPDSGVKGEGGTIFTGFCPNFSNLSDGKKQFFFDKR